MSAHSRRVVLQRSVCMIFFFMSVYTLLTCRADCFAAINKKKSGEVYVIIFISSNWYVWEFIIIIFFKFSVGKYFKLYRTN